MIQLLESLALRFGHVRGERFSPFFCPVLLGNGNLRVWPKKLVEKQPFAKLKDRTMTRLLTFVLMITATATFASAQGGGLPMTDQLGGGGGFGSNAGGYSSGYTPRVASTRAPTYRPSTGGFRSVGQGISPQQVQNIANAAAALGPALQQARQNLQQVRAQNGGYLIPRNGNSGFGSGGGRLINRMLNGQPNGGWQGMNRYTDTFGHADARRVQQSLVNDGYRNAQIYGNPNNGWRQQQGLTPIYGVYRGR